MMTPFRAFPSIRPAVAAGLLFLLAGPAKAQDWNLDPTYGSVGLKSGFLPDPYSVEVFAGGKIQTKLGGVQAWVAHAPDFRLVYEAGQYPLTLHVISDADTTLLVNLPDGTWVANDDGPGNGLNPLLRFDKPQSGRYEIWVGTFKDEGFPKATLYITEYNYPPQQPPPVAIAPPPPAPAAPPPVVARPPARPGLTLNNQIAPARPARPAMTRRKSSANEVFSGIQYAVGEIKKAWSEVPPEDKLKLAEIGRKLKEWDEARAAKQRERIEWAMRATYAAGDTVQDIGPLDMWHGIIRVIDGDYYWIEITWFNTALRRLDQTTYKGSQLRPFVKGQFSR